MPILASGLDSSRTLLTQASRHSFTSGQSTHRPTTCPLNHFLLPPRCSLRPQGKTIRIWQNCSWALGLPSRAAKQAVMCPAWKGPFIFPALHMLGDGKPSQKPGHSTPTQTPSPDHVFKSVPVLYLHPGASDLYWFSSGQPSPLQPLPDRPFRNPNWITVLPC